MYVTNVMKKLRITVLMLSILLVSEVLFAQNATLAGKLSDEKSAAVGFASVSLLKATDSSLVASVTANKEGIFNIPSPEAGKYFLRITAIGFDVKRTDIFELVASNTAKDFGTIALRTDPKLMNDVTVTALRPTITQLADRLVVNIQGTAMAAGNTAFGVLSKSPGVFVDPEGNIQLNGRGGVTVMIDGRLTYLSARDLRNLLESTPAENIKSIEIITNPSAKYDAEGTSGIINIVFKKNVMQGINGNVYTGYSTNLKQHFYNAGATINHKSGRWNSFLITDFNRRGGGR